ncbi:MAG: oligosaccharide flippase family protein [Clostridia bacterium]|nr:oligosaccharide flippase family protein [Clostridia bacterium]
MREVKSVFKTVSMITIFSVVTRVFGFVFRIFLSRKLGAEGLGVYQIAASIMGIFMTLVASGLPLVTAKMCAGYEHTKQMDKKNITVTSATIIALIISLVSTSVIALFQSVFVNIVGNHLVVELMLLMCPAIIFSAVYAVFRGALWGKNSFFWVSFTELVEQVVRLILTFIMLYSVSDMFSATRITAKAFSITCLISATLVAVIYFVDGGRLKFKKGQYRPLIKSSAPITGVRIASSLIQPLTATLIPMLLIGIGYTSSQAISEYGILMGMTFPLLFAPLSVVGSLSMVLVPKISTLKVSNQYEQIASNIESSLNASLFLSMLLIPLFISVGDLIGIVLFNNLHAGIYLQLSAVCILPIVLSNITSSILNALSLEGKSFINYFIGSVVMFVCLFALTPIVRINSVIIAFFLSMGITAILNFRTIKKAVPSLSYRILLDLFKYAIIIIPTSLIGHFVSNILYHFLPAFIAGVIGGGLSMLLTLILLQMSNIYNAPFKMLKNILKKKRNNT